MNGRSKRRKLFEEQLSFSEQPIRQHTSARIRQHTYITYAIYDTLVSSICTVSRKMPVGRPSLGMARVFTATGAWSCTLA